MGDGKREGASEPRYNEAQWGAAPENEGGYALSGKIMLSAVIVLFFVIVIMAGLHLYARWFLLLGGRRRRTHPPQFVFHVDASSPAPAVSAVTRGLDAALVKSLPVFSFAPKNHPQETLDCAVCLSEFEGSEKGLRLPRCGHCFHIDCINMWFHSHSTCPLCRTPVDGGSSAEGTPAPSLAVLAAAVGEPGSTRSEPGGLGSVDDGASAGARRKEGDLVGVSIELPRRSGGFGRVEESASPSPSPSSGGGRMRSLKRMVSREIRAAFSPAAAAPSSSGGHRQEPDLELGHPPRPVVE